MSLRRWLTSTTNVKTATISSSVKLSAIGSEVSLADLNHASAAVSLNSDRKKLRSKTVPPAVKVSVVKHLNIYGMNSALRTFKTRYPDLNFCETSVRRWKKAQSQASSQGIELIKAFPDKRGRPNFLSGELVSKVNQIIVGSRAAGIGICMDDVIAIGNLVTSVNSPNLLEENGGCV